MYKNIKLGISIGIFSATS